MFIIICAPIINEKEACIATNDESTERKKRIRVQVHNQRLLRFKIRIKMLRRLQSVEDPELARSPFALPLFDACSSSTS